MQAFRNFRTYFFRGMAALLPTVLTIWVFVQIYLFVQNNISVHINRFLTKMILSFTDRYAEEFLVDFWVNGKGQITGFILAMIAVVMLGAFLASVVGRTLWRIFEKALMRVPLIKKIYPYIKQVTDFVLAKKDFAANEVVALEYPRKGVFSIGMVTGQGLQCLADVTGRDFLSVFVPTSPTPFTGYVVLIPREEIIVLNITLEEAIRFTISGGVITPAKLKAFQARTFEGKNVEV